MVIGVIIAPYALSAEASEKGSGLHLTANADGTFSVISHSTPLGVLLSEISNTSNVDIYVDSASK